MQSIKATGNISSIAPMSFENRLRIRPIKIKNYDQLFKYT